MRNPVEGRFRRAYFRLVPAVIAICLSACSDDDADSLVTPDYDEIRFVVSGAGTGTGLVTAGPAPADLDCEITAGVSAGKCSDDFADAGGGGVFNVSAAAGAGSIFTGWENLVCTPTNAGPCDIDCGPADDDATCVLSFDDTAGDVDYELTARFELDGAANVVISDDFESNTACNDWSSTVAGNGDFSESSDCAASGGNPDKWRRMQHDVQDVGNLVVYHKYNGQTYTPSIDGPIARIRYSDSRVVKIPAFVGGQVGATVLLEQDGQRFTAAADNFGDTEWVNFTVELTAADFSPAPGPDFSATGGEIFFGYTRSNSNTSAGTLSTSLHGIDNWRVEIVREP